MPGSQELTNFLLENNAVLLRSGYFESQQLHVVSKNDIVISSNVQEVTQNLLAAIRSRKHDFEHVASVVIFTNFSSEANKLIQVFVADAL